MRIAMYVLLGIIGAVVLFYFFPTMLISNVIYTVLFVRTSKKKWTRSCNDYNEEQQQMFS